MPPRIAIFLLLVGLGSRASAADQCPLDRVVFKDRGTGRQFVAQRVAVDYGYLCPEETPASQRRYSRRVKSLQEQCLGPFGDTIIEGLLDGSRAYAVYSVSKAVPCCVWYSYEGGDPSATAQVKEWLAPEDVPTITLGNEWYTIGPPNPPYDPDQGPMGGGEFVPEVCRPR